MDKVCEICGSDRNAKEIVICSQCRGASQHIYCTHGQQPDSVPNEWYCEGCSGSGSKPAGTKPKPVGPAGTSGVLQAYPSGVGNVESKAPQNKAIQAYGSGHNTEMNDQQPGPYIILRDDEPYPPVDQVCWRGEFEIFHVVKQKFTEIRAQTPGKLHRKAYEMIKTMPEKLQLSKHRRRDIWPKSFESNPPTMRDIGVYFFGKELPEYRDQYRNLVKRMDRLDEALQCSLGDIQFLLFTSTHLDEESQAALRSEGRNNKFLWGMFLHTKPKEQQQEQPDVAAIDAAENLLLLRSEGNQRVQMVDKPDNDPEFPPGFEGIVRGTAPPGYPQKRSKLN